MSEMVITGAAGVPFNRNISTTAPLTGGGDLSADRTIGITQATAGTSGYLKNTDWVIFNAKMSNVMSALGDLIYGGALGAPTRLPIDADHHKILHGGGAPNWASVDEEDLVLTNVGTNDASITQHGFLPRLSNNAAQFLTGIGTWATPAAGAVTAYTSVSGTASTVAVTHGFGQYPVVQCFDSGTGAVVVPTSITHTSTSAFTVVFGGSTNYTIVATIGSPGAQAYKATAVDYTVLTTDRIIKVTVAGKTITLPTAVGYTGLEFVIDNASNGDIILDANGTEKIEGELTQTLPYNSAIHVFSDGSGWRIY